MKKKVIPVLGILLCTALTGCGTPSVKNTYEGGMRKYYEMSDGTWQCEGYTYQYCLEITGRLNAAAADSTYVYLSNTPEISFDRAWKAARLSSNSNDYFSKDEAVLVEMK